MRRNPLIAIDRAMFNDRLIAVDLAPGNRRMDANGNLHIETNNIGKANVCPYYGREIPGWPALGLDANKLYMLYRDPAELAKSEQDWNNIQVTYDHPPESARTLKIPKHAIVGSTGTNAAFEPPYMRNSIVIWDSAAVDLVNNKKRFQLSPAYQFKAVMEPGVAEGIAFDGKMTDIKPNHVALVERGRAGPDVAVGDSKPEIPKMLKSRRALMLQGALGAHVAPLLAADAKIDFTPTLETVAVAEFAEPATLAAKLFALTEGKLAEDAALEVAEFADIVTAVAGIVLAEDDAIPEPKTPPAPKVVTKEVPVGITQAAMDAAIKTAVDNATESTVTRMAAIREAELAVEPHIGKLKQALDSAAGVYKLALDHLKVDLNGVPEEAYGAILKALPKPEAKRAEAPARRLGLDSEARKKVNEMFPDAKPLIRS